MHTVSLAEARQKALDARKLRIDGITPLVARKQKQSAAALADAKIMTFDSGRKRTDLSIRGPFLALTELAKATTAVDIGLRLPGLLVPIAFSADSRW